MNHAISCSADIITPGEAVAYYRATLAGVRRVTCHEKKVRIVFEHEAIHLFSDAPPKNLSPADRQAWLDAIPDDLRVERRLPNGRIELRRFNADRAHLLDHVLRAVSLFTVSVPGTGQDGRENRMIHGPALADGRYMRVVLRPGPGDAWTCVSAYPVDRDEWMKMRRAKSAKFPPE